MSVSCDWGHYKANICDALLDDIEILDDIQKPSLSIVSDSNTSDFSLDKNIRGEISSICELGADQIEGEDILSKSYQTKFHSMEIQSLRLENNFKNGQKQKSISLHDISDFSSSLYNLKPGNGISCDTLHSHSLSSTTKSKDSGIHRSMSCLSLASGNKNYSHVESKVKAYIQNIKDSEAQRKKTLKSVARSSPETSFVITPVTKNVEEPVQLKQKISELESELKEKSVLLDIQQEQYNALLYKYAEAKNVIDSLRLKSFSVYNNSSVNDFNTSYCIQSTSLPDTVENTKRSNMYTQDKSVLNEMSLVKHSTPISSPKQIRNELGPVCSIFSTSSRLNKQYTSLSVNLPREASFERVKKWQQSLPSINLLETCTGTSNSDTSLVNHHLCVSNKKQFKSKQSTEVHGNSLIKVQNNKSMSEKLCQTKPIESCNNKLHKGKSSKSQNRRNNYSKSIKKLVRQKQCVKNSELKDLLLNSNEQKVSSTSDMLMLQTGKILNKSSLFTEYRDTNINHKKYRRKPKLGVSSDDDSSSDDESSYLPPSSSHDLNLAHLTSDDSSSIASSVLDSVNEFYNLVQKQSPKRKINYLNSYSPSKVVKLKETSQSELDGRTDLFKSKSNFSSQLLKESRLNHLFPGRVHKITRKFQAVDMTDEVWWKTITHAELEKSKNLEECLNNAEYFVMILSDGLKKVESTLYKPPRIV